VKADHKQYATQSRRVWRVYLDQDLGRSEARLEHRQAHYLGRVLRLQRGDSVTAFNGRGQERLARIASLTRREGLLELLDHLHPMPEPALDVVLLQALLKSEAMDIVIQKATELGVRAIALVDAVNSVTRLDTERAARRMEHWQLKSRGACEQSGRHRPVLLEAPRALTDCLADLDASRLKLLLEPDRDHSSQPLPQSAAAVCIAAGPESGWSGRELEQMDRAGFRCLSLGPRVLRAETASIAACALVQSRWGDMRWPDLP
jgi:16S rRNA (uracil1498-N3)-methyltransferase